MDRFIGRADELAKLKTLLEKKTSSIAVLKGRRRIGKSKLAEEFGKLFPKTYIITGLAPNKRITAQMEREDCAAQLERIAGIKGLKADD